MNGWTPERQKRQAELVQHWMPWMHSTGPKTDEGKETCSQNALKNGMHTAEMRKLRRLLSEQARMLGEIQES